MICKTAWRSWHF